MSDVHLVHCQQLPEPDPDAALLRDALVEAGLSAHWRAWDDDAVPWRDATLTVLRSCWNYFRQPQDFLAWAERAARVSCLLNPLPVVRGNYHKRYLLELAARGLPVVPTRCLQRGSRARLAELLRHERWARAVVKPAVSAGSYETFVCTGEPGEGERFRALLAGTDVLVQPYLEQVEQDGERAVVWIDGAISHAVRKNPRFAGADESVSDALPVRPAEQELAETVLAPIAAELLYARVDMVRGPKGRPMLMELELIEPSLFLLQHPPALQRLVAALVRRCRTH